MATQTQNANVNTTTNVNGATSTHRSIYQRYAQGIMTLHENQRLTRSAIRRRLRTMDKELKTKNAPAAVRRKANNSIKELAGKLFNMKSPSQKASRQANEAPSKEHALKGVSFLNTKQVTEMHKLGFATIEEVQSASPEEVLAILDAPGIGRKTFERIIDAL